MIVGEALQLLVLCLQLRTQLMGERIMLYCKVLFFYHSDPLTGSLTYLHVVLMY